MKVIYGQKIQMGEVYLGDVRAGATQISLYPLTVTQIKTKDKDGYDSIQVGFSQPSKKNRRPFGKHRELKATENLELGSVINPKDVISLGAICHIQGTSKGKGFAGVVKRWNFAGGPRTHGQSDRLRAPGSIGQGTTPGRVHKGKKMPGRMGSDTLTMKKSQVVAFDDSNNTIWVTGPVPGSRNSLLRLTIIDQKDLGPVSYVTNQKPVLTTEPPASPVAPQTDHQEPQVEAEVKA